MPNNECIPYYEPAARVTAKAGADIIGKRFVKVGATITGGPTGTEDVNVVPATAAAKAFGVAVYDVLSGEYVPVICQPGMIVPVTLLANTSAGAEVEVGAGGKAAVFGSGIKAGLLLSDGVADGDGMIKLY